MADTVHPVSRSNHLTETSDFVVLCGSLQALLCSDALGLAVHELSLNDREHHHESFARLELTNKAQSLRMRENEALIELDKDQQLRPPVLSVKRLLLKLQEGVASSL